MTVGHRAFAAPPARTDLAPKVVMYSREYGPEEFKYDTLAEAQKAMQRLAAEILKQQDGIERTLYLVLCTQHVESPSDARLDCDP